MTNETEAPFAARLSQPEYVTDVPYSRTFLYQLAPATLRLVAAVNGVPAPPRDDFDYCEIGSANGDTLVTLAAANPEARFVGIDINAEHVAFASALANEGGLTNVRFVEHDFEGLERGALPAFDFIGAHGMLSWISPAKREALLEFASATLKPGGLLYVGYNALPGWAALEPLRRLLLDHGGSSDSTLERARAGFAFMRRLADAGAAYFAKQPNAKAMLSLIESAGLPYVAHEYMNAHWEPMYFADVAKEMRAHDLRYVGQLPLYLNVPDLAMPRALKEIAMSFGDRVAFDGIKDFAVNELHRSDVYVKGEVTRLESAMRDFFESTAFGTSTAAPIPRSARLPICTLEFTGPIYDALIPALARGAASATELARLPKLASFGAKRIGECLLNLSLGGQVVPMRPRRPHASGGSRYRVPLEHNRVALRRSLFDADAPLVLASPATGTGLNVSLFEALCLHVLTEVEPSERPSFVRSLVNDRGTRITLDERPMHGDKLVRAVTREVDGFDASRGPKLLELGIVEAAPTESWRSR